VCPTLAVLVEGHQALCRGDGGGRLARGQGEASTLTALQLASQLARIPLPPSPATSSPRTLSSSPSLLQVAGKDVAYGTSEKAKDVSHGAKARERARPNQSCTCERPALHALARAPSSLPSLICPRRRPSLPACLPAAGGG
jgi:hypothetical protein